MPGYIIKQNIALIPVYSKGQVRGNEELNYNIQWLKGKERPLKSFIAICLELHDSERKERKKFNNKINFQYTFYKPNNISLLPQNQDLLLNKPLETNFSVLC